MGSLFCCLTTLTMKNFFLITNMNFHWCCFESFPLIGYQREEISTSLSSPSHKNRPLHLPWVNKASILSCFPCILLSVPFTIFLTEIIFTSLYCIAQTAPSAGGKTAQHREEQDSTFPHPTGSAGPDALQYTAHLFLLCYCQQYHSRHLLQSAHTCRITPSQLQKLAFALIKFCMSCDCVVL